MKFTGAAIGIGGTANVIALATSGASVTGKLDVGPTTAARNFIVTSAGDTTISGTLGVTGATTLAGVQTGAATLASAIVTGSLQSGAATLASASVNGALTVTGLTSMATAAVSSTLEVTGVTTLKEDVSMTKGAAAISHTGTSLTISSTGFVDVENVRFTGPDIGVSGAAKVITVQTTGASVTGLLDVGTTAARNFVVTKDGDTAITGTLGVTGATTLAGVQTGAATLASATVTGSLQSGAATLASATVSGTLGVTGATILAGVQTGAATLASAIVTGTLRSGAATLASATVNGLTSMATATVSSTLEVTGVTTLKEDVSMTKGAAAISHTGTSLTISSTGFVDVENVRFTGPDIGVSGAAKVITVQTTGASVTGLLDVGTTAARNFVVTKDGDTAITGTLGVTGATTLAGVQTGAATLASATVTGSLQSGAATLASATVSGTLGVTGATTLAGVQTGAATLASAIVTGTLRSGAATLASATVNGLTSMATATVSSTLEVTGVTTLKEDVSMTKGAAAISHTGTSLTISSTGFVDVENVRFTGPDIGVSGAAKVITVQTTGASVTGLLDVGTTAARNFVVTKDGDTAITGTLGVTGATTLAGVQTGAATIASASVGGTLGVTGATTLSSADLSTTLTVTGLTTLKNDIDLMNSITIINHRGVTGLQITSAGYVEVESVKFTGAAIGIGARVNVIALATTGASVTGTLQTSGLATLHSATVTNALQVNGLSTLASATVTGATTMATATVSSTLDVTKRVTTLGEDVAMTKPSRRDHAHCRDLARDHERGLRGGGEREVHRDCHGSHYGHRRDD